MDRGDAEYYISSCRQLDAGCIVHSIEWEGICTSDSRVELALRAAKDEAGLEQAGWIPVEAGKDLRGLALGGVIQYRLALCARCGCGTPRIKKVTVNIDGESENTKK